MERTTIVDLSFIVLTSLKNKDNKQAFIKAVFAFHFRCMQ